MEHRAGRNAYPTYRQECLSLPTGWEVGVTEQKINSFCSAERVQALRPTRYKAGKNASPT